MDIPYLHYTDDTPQVRTKNVLGIDIVVIKVLEPFIYNHIVSPACLPIEPIQPGSVCYVSGWGTTKPLIFGKGVHIT